MKKHFILNNIMTIILLLLSTNANAQTRYLDDLFEVKKADTAIVYAEVQSLKFPYLSEEKTEKQQLFMDVYQPKGDIKTNRPCILVIHGGSFLYGHRGEKNIIRIAEDMAKKGYVTVTIDYRLGFNSLNREASARAVYRSVQDTKAAIRFLKGNYQVFGIDTTHIFAFGASAGSIAAMHAAYLEESECCTIPATLDDLGCLSCSGNTLKHTDEPCAIANLWGAVIDTNIINSEKNIPIISFHGTKDNIVSPDSVSPFNISTFPALSGTNLITPRLKHLGIKTEYYKFNKGHAPWLTAEKEPIYNTILNKTTLFFYDYLQKNPLNSIDELTYKSIKSDFQIYPNPTTEFINIDLSNYYTDITIQITNSLGEIVRDIDIPKETQKETITFNLRDLPKGYYYLSINDNNQNQSQLFCKSE